MTGGQWEGYAEAMDALKSIVSEVARDDVMAAAMLNAVGRPMALEMKARAVRQPPAPDMADSLSASISTQGGRAPGTVVVAVGPRKSMPHSWIARWIEFGTRHMGARPFMRPVYDEWLDRITPEFVKAVRPVYDRAVKRYARKAAKA